MILQASAATDVGMRRRVNEDRYALVPDLGLYLVADGMGGHKAGQLASQLAAEAAVRAAKTLEGAAVSLSEKLRQIVAFLSSLNVQLNRPAMQLRLPAHWPSVGYWTILKASDAFVLKLRGGEAVTLPPAVLSTEHHEIEHLLVDDNFSKLLSAGFRI